MIETQPMKLLCIGQSGQVARALQAVSKERDIDLVALGRPQVDLTNRKSLEIAIEQHAPDIIVNAAAFTQVDLAETDKDTAHAVNADGPKALAEICAQRSIPLIHISTEYVFDGSGAEAFGEDASTAPINAYGATKQAGEQAIGTACDQHVILRTSWVYSPFGSNFIKTMLRLAREKGGASVVDDQIGSPTSAIDIADAILDIADQIHGHPQPNQFGIFHFAAAGAASWADVAALIFETYEARTGCKIALKRIPSSDYPTPAARPLNSRLKTAKITETFGIKTKQWTDRVRETVNRLMDEGS